MVLVSTLAHLTKFGTKSLPVFVCLLLCNNNASSSDSTNTHFTRKDMPHLVLKRFYTIARLTKTCNSFFATALPNHTKLVSLLPSFIQSAFAATTHPAISMLADILSLLQHQHIRSHIEAAHATNSLEPVHKLWKEICAYRFLGDDLFTQEFCQILYLLLAHCAQDNTYKRLTDGYNDVTKSSNPANSSSANAFAQSLTPSDTLAITQRFYLIQRLQHAVAVCSNLYRSSGDPAFTIMLALWDDILQYKNIDKVAVSFGICSSLIALLHSAQNHHRLATSTIEPPVLASSRSEIVDPSADNTSSYFASPTSPANPDHEALEKLLEYIDALTDSYHYKAY